MPVSTELLRAAWAALPEDTVRRLADQRGIRGAAKLSLAAVTDRLAGDAAHLTVSLSALSPGEFATVAGVFGVPADDISRLTAKLAPSQIVTDSGRERLRAEARKLAHTLPPMTAADLLAAAEPLHRPVVHLTTDPGDLAAVWLGDRFSRKRGPRPWLAVDLSRHPDADLRRPGVLHVVIDPNELTAEPVEVVPGPLPTPKKGQVPLSAVAADELPHTDILFQEGPPVVREWVAACAARGHVLLDGWGSWGSDSFPLQDTIRGYLDAQRRTHPLTTEPLDAERVYAQLGGWPVPWPDGTPLEQNGRRLVLRTYRGGEPHVEVWAAGDGYAVDLRIT